METLIEVEKKARVENWKLTKEKLFNNLSLLLEKSTLVSSIILLLIEIRFCQKIYKDRNLKPYLIGSKNFVFFLNKVTSPLNLKLFQL